MELGQLAVLILFSHFGETIVARQPQEGTTKLIVVTVSMCPFTALLSKLRHAAQPADVTHTMKSITRFWPLC
jgi:hypothetical protein